MNQPALRVDDLSKTYTIYDHPRDRFVELLTGRSQGRLIHALRPISFAVERGQCIGIVGHNGSGKSTLLRIIAGVLSATTGSVAVNGRLTALLELGSGFNPEFTGRENVFFNAMLHGLSEREIEEKFDAIADFADIGDAMKRPIKTYSSGMFVRLAFAVSANLNPDILIVDEALAVGDVFFQQKCFERLRTLRDGGVTLLFVSHDGGSIQRLCDRAILLENGAAICDGNPKEVLDVYLGRELHHREDHEVGETEEFIEVTSKGAVRSAGDLIDWHVRVLDATDTPVESVLSGRGVRIEAQVIFARGFDDPHIGFKIRDRMGVVVYGANTLTLGQPIGPVAAGESIAVSFTFEASIAPGEYSIALGIAANGHSGIAFRHTILFIHDAGMLKVLPDTEAGIWEGLTDLRPMVTIVHQRSLLPSRT